MPVLSKKPNKLLLVINLVRLLAYHDPFVGTIPISCRDTTYATGVMDREKDL